MEGLDLSEIVLFLVSDVPLVGGGNGPLGDDERAMSGGEASVGR